MSQSEYWDYIRSHAFRKVREKALKRDQGCRLCGEKEGRLEVHHRTYVRFGHERPKDTTTLCVTCHHLFHDVIAPVVRFEGFKGFDLKRRDRLKESGILEALDRLKEGYDKVPTVLPEIPGGEGGRSIPLESTPVDEGGVE